MNKKDPNDFTPPSNRGRIQAQGGGTEKSESWAQSDPPTVDEMLEMCRLLENQLTPKEKKDRKKPLADLRAFIKNAAKYGGVESPCSKSYKKAGSADIRVDLEVSKGKACVRRKED